jgi:hypothetical protein
MEGNFLQQLYCVDCSTQYVPQHSLVLFHVDAWEPGWNIIRKLLASVYVGPQAGEENWGKEVSA